MFGRLGTTELLLILALVLLLFGGRKIPELAKSLAEGIKNFKKGAALQEEDDKSGARKETAQKEQPHGAASGQKPGFSQPAISARSLDPHQIGGQESGSKPKKGEFVDVEPRDEQK